MPPLNLYSTSVFSLSLKSETATAKPGTKKAVWRARCIRAAASRCNSLTNISGSGQNLTLVPVPDFTALPATFRPASLVNFAFGPSPLKTPVAPLWKDAV